MEIGRNLATCVIFVIITFHTNMVSAISNEACTQFLATEPKAMDSDFTDRGYATLFTTADGDYELRNSIRFFVIGTVAEDNDTTSLCVGFRDTTSSSNRILDTGSDISIASVTLETIMHRPTGIVNVSAQCWSHKSDLGLCDPVFLPMPGVLDTALYVHPPVSADFWTHLQDEHLFTNSSWIKRMSIQSNEETFPSSWVASLQISSLVSLEIKGNDWKRPQTLLSHLESLERLDLTDNNIQQLPQDLFENTPLLRDLLLARNNLTVFPQGLDKLPGLTLLDITNPEGRAELAISDAELETIQGVHIFGLENINLSTNITTLLNLPRLSFLNLSGCGINGIDDISDEENIPLHRKSMMTLDLSKNNLAKLPLRLFSTLKKLRTLYLQGNAFQTCPASVLQGMTDLVDLHLSKNNISEITPSCFDKLHDRIRYLDLSHNQISRLSDGVFKHLRSLRTLILSHNKLSAIYPHTFEGVSDLRILDLSHNQLISGIYFKNINIDTLRLSDNGLVSLSNISNSETTITYLDVSMNNLSRWTITSSIKRLNISNNIISKISEEILSNFDNAIQMVDLGGNPLNCCDGNLTVLKKWLKTTHIDIRNLGTKHLLTCFVPGENQKYPIRTFELEQVLCSTANNPDYHGKGQKNVKSLYAVIGVLSVVVCILSVVLIYVWYSHKHNLLKWFQFS